MKLNISKSNILIIALLLLLAFGGGYLAVHRPPKAPVGNVFVCAHQAVPFRANITDCLAVKVVPNEKILADTLTSPTANLAFILVNPNGTAAVGSSAYEIYKTFSSLKSVTGISPDIVYTQKWPDQPNAAVMSIQNATYQAPIIWLRPNQTKTEIDVNGPQIIVYAKNQYDLDAATCKIAILLINETMNC